MNVSEKRYLFIFEFNNEISIQIDTSKLKNIFFKKSINPFVEKEKHIISMLNETNSEDIVYFLYNNASIYIHMKKYIRYIKNIKNFNIITIDYNTFYKSLDEYDVL